jgi:membrane protease YdiL (CAAX protease family)
MSSLPQPSQAPRPLTPAAAAIYAFLQLLGLFFVYGLLSATLAEGAEASWVYYAVAGLVSTLGVLYLALSRHAPGEPTWKALGLVTPRGGREWGVIGLGVLFGLGLLPVAAELSAFMIGVLPVEQGDVEAEERARLIMSASSATRWIANGILVTCVPLLEEGLFRGLLQRRLAGVDARRAGLLIAFLYALAQSDPREMPAALLLGLGLARLRRVGETTWSAVAAHVTHVALPLALVWLSHARLDAPDDMTTSSLPLPIVAGGGALALITSFALWKMRARDVA